VVTRKQGKGILILKSSTSKREIYLFIHRDIHSVDKNLEKVLEMGNRVPLQVQETRYRGVYLDGSVGKEGIGHADKSSDISTFYVVDKPVGLGAVLDTFIMDLTHDVSEAMVDFFS